MYYFIYGYLFSLAVIEVYCEEKQSVLVKSFNIFILPYLALEVFKYGQGADYITYQHFYNNNQLEIFEPLFRLLIHASQTLGLSFSVFYALVTMGIILFFISSIKKYSSYPYTSFFLLVSSYSVYMHTVIRQGIALVLSTHILLYLYKQMCKKTKEKLPKKIMYLYFFIPSMFHKSFLILSFILALCYYLKANYDKNFDQVLTKMEQLGMWDIVLLSLSIFLISKYLLVYFLKLYTLTNPSSKLVFYVNPTSFLSYMYVLLSYIIFELLVRFGCQKTDSKPFTYNTDIIFLRTYILYYSFLTSSHLLASRGSVYLIIISIYFIPKYVVSLLSSLRSIAPYRFLKLALILLFISIQMINYDRFLATEIRFGNYRTIYYPYVSVFNTDKIYEVSDYVLPE